MGCAIPPLRHTMWHRWRPLGDTIWETSRVVWSSEFMSNSLDFCKNEVWCSCLSVMGDGGTCCGFPRANWWRSNDPAKTLRDGATHTITDTYPFVSAIIPWITEVLQQTRHRVLTVQRKVSDGPWESSWEDRQGCGIQGCLVQCKACEDASLAVWTMSSRWGERKRGLSQRVSTRRAPKWAGACQTG